MTPYRGTSLVAAALALTSPLAYAVGDTDAIRSMMGGVPACEAAPSECARVYGQPLPGQDPARSSQEATAVLKTLIEKAEAKESKTISLPRVVEKEGRIDTIVNRSLSFEKRDGIRAVVLRRSIHWIGGTGSLDTYHFYTDPQAKEPIAVNFCVLPTAPLEARTPYIRIPTLRCAETPVSENTKGIFRKEFAYWLDNADKAK